MSTRLFIIHINSSIENKEYQMKSGKNACGRLLFYNENQHLINICIETIPIKTIWNCVRASSSIFFFISKSF